MAELMKVTCGTMKRTEIEFDLDKYGECIDNGATDDEKKCARSLLYYTMNDNKFIDDGYRNNDAVNGCIALHVMGYDPVEWFDNFFEDKEDGVFYHCDVEAFADHVERVSKYLHRWGPKGKEGIALDYRLG